MVHEQLGREDVLGDGHDDGGVEEMVSGQNAVKYVGVMLRVDYHYSSK